jgi:RNA polymerase sigma factor (sigma-70 family)
MVTSTLARRISEEAVRQRAEEILRTKIDFVPNAGFADNDGAGNEIVAATLRGTNSKDKAPAELPGHLRSICESELLTHEQETALFREMNRLKYCADALRMGLDSEHIVAQTVDSVEALLSQAQRIRDHIIRANMRLVMSIVKKFVTPMQPFDDLLSDGICTLMDAVEKFDYDRGFRFSTYAYRSIVRNACRTATTVSKQEARFTRDAESWAFEQEGDHSASAMSDQVWGNLRELTASLLDHLDRREQFVIRSRYALGAHRKVRTFQCLADKLGVSKERVRQLEQRAVGKLRKLASAFDMDELFGAAIV